MDSVMMMGRGGWLHDVVAATPFVAVASAAGVFLPGAGATAIVATSGAIADDTGNVVVNDNVVVVAAVVFLHGAGATAAAAAGATAGDTHNAAAADTTPAAVAAL